MCYNICKKSSRNCFFFAFPRIGTQMFCCFLYTAFDVTVFNFDNISKSNSQLNLSFNKIVTK